MATTVFESNTPNNLAAVNMARIPRQAIDADRWNRCVSNAFNENPLAYTWVLDHLTPSWEGLIINDYEGVMPLPASTSKRIKMLQMPYEVLTLGIFSALPSLSNLLPHIFHHPLMADYRFISYNGSPTSDEIPQLPEITIRQTYELDLHRPYEEIYRRYSNSHRRNIKAFYKNNLEIITHQEPGAFVHLTAEVSKLRPELFMPPEYQRRFEAMTKEAIARQKGVNYLVKEHDQTIAASFFLLGEKKCIPFHLANVMGHRKRASFALIDHFIKSHAGENKHLDFVGSMLPNVAEFNHRFGATPIQYPSVTINRLPFLLRLAKRWKLKHRLEQVLSKKNTP